jgi:hypothetical protein
MTRMTPAKILITSALIKFNTRRTVYSVKSTHPYFKEAKKALQEGDTNLAAIYARRDSGTAARVVGNDVVFEGHKFDPIFAEAYLISQELGMSVKSLDLFFKNLASNPNPISVMAFTKFIAKGKMPITDRGTFLAYKRINDNWKDCHTNKFDNKPGVTNKMDRKDVDAVQTNTCSTGFHVCSHEYLKNFGGMHDVVVEINPRDVVAVPPDYNLTKMRCCEYKVLCSLPYFKKQIASSYQDALGNIPHFLTGQMETWDVMFDVK